MTLRDILVGRPGTFRIMERTYYPSWMEDELTKKEIKDGMLSGYCLWDGRFLLSMDGDFYTLDEEVDRYEWEDDGSLTYWCHCEWVRSS